VPLDIDNLPGALAQHVGKRVALHAKFYELWGERLSLHTLEGDESFLVRSSGTPELHRQLASERDEAGLELVKGTSNILVRGRVESTGGRPVVIVDHVQRLPDDRPLYEERKRRLSADDEEGRRQLAYHLQKRARRYSSQDLEQISIEIFGEAIDIKRRRLEGDAAGLLGVEEYLELARREETAIELLGSIVLDEGAPQGVRAKAVERLRQLGARQRLTADGLRYISARRFRQQEGLLCRGERTLTLAQAELEDIAALYRTSFAAARAAGELFLIPVRLETEYSEAAAAGSVMDGMLPAEVVRAFGYPEYCDGLEVQLAEKNSRCIQWVYRKRGLRIYFILSSVRAGLDGKEALCVYQFKGEKDPYPE
jgi:hypothetical protein